MRSLLPIGLAATTLCALGICLPACRPGAAVRAETSGIPAKTAATTPTAGLNARPPVVEKASTTKVAEPPADISAYLAAKNGGAASNLSAPAALSADEEKELLGILGKLPPFPAYAYSGCHDRAHALWLQLPEKFRAKTAKVWLFAPAATTLAFPDVITIPSLGGQSPKWQYHVALVYESGTGRRVLDPASSGWERQPRSMAEWLEPLALPPRTVMATLPPRHYLFYAVASDAGPTTNRLRTVMNTGEFFECTGACRSNKNIEESLARDLVGTILATEGGCTYLRNVVDQPGELLNKLRSTDGSTPKECAPLVKRFEETRTRWTEILWRSSATSVSAR